MNTLRIPGSAVVRSRSVLCAVTRLTVLVIAAGSVGLLPGCAVDIPPGLLDGVDRVDPGDVVPIDEQTVTVRFRNWAVNEAVNVEFFTAGDPLASLPEDLFLPEHRVTTSIGVAGTGIIEPLKEDVIELPCTTDLIIGTSGGSFLDNETGELRGTGTPRWAQEGPLGLCNSTVTFEFFGDGVDFTTTLSIGD